MKYKVYFERLMSTIFIFLIISCNTQNPKNDKELSDTTSRRTETPGAIAFDSSRSVTVISPDLYKKLSDTLNIRILEGTYKPGDSSIMHAHPDFALYVLEGSTVELTSMDGNKQTIEFKEDMAVVLPASTHSAKNIGKTTLRLIVVEVNRPRG
ncbi:MAG TPA: cupin domain-containing protein [Chitinophagaceae bacterium]|nr:cupin domain-containing protein [Chitinophagaceae bacterium]